MTSSKTQLDTGLIRELAELLSETNLTEIEIEQGGTRVRVSRAGSVAVQTVAAPALPAAAATAGASASESAADPSRHPGAVKSPMVGTAYRAPSPGAPAFVEVGSEVRQGQTVLIIEAMKTMNQIAAPKAGRVKEILVGDGQPVEFGEALMIVE
ncbi:MAG: acetyl-CoA carboxylase biotin carboxyl carrier protein [Parvibaculaceae bacterium]